MGEAEEDGEGPGAPEGPRDVGGDEGERCQAQQRRRTRLHPGPSAPFSLPFSGRPTCVRGQATDASPLLILKDNGHGKWMG